jgi:hypothetical protein
MKECRKFEMTVGFWSCVPFLLVSSEIQGSYDKTVEKVYQGIDIDLDM